MKQRCAAVRDENTDDLIESVLANETAVGCVDLMPQCTAGRAKLLLGPMYGKKGSVGPHGLPFARAGVRDVWKKMPPKSRPYYLNQARARSQYEMPEGWDPNGPNEQVIITPEDEEERDEL